MSFSFSKSGRPLPHGRGSVLSTPAPNRDREGVPMVLRPAESHEDTVRPAHSRAAALFPGNLDTEPPCVSKRVFRSPCNARSPAPNRDREGADVFAGVFNSAASFNRVDDWFAITEFHHCRCHGSGGRPIRAGALFVAQALSLQRRYSSRRMTFGPGMPGPQEWSPAVGARHASLSQVNARHEYLRRHRCLVT